MVVAFNNTSHLLRLKEARRDGDLLLQLIAKRSNVKCKKSWFIDILSIRFSCCIYLHCIAFRNICIYVYLHINISYIYIQHIYVHLSLSLSLCPSPLYLFVPPSVCLSVYSLSTVCLHLNNVQCRSSESMPIEMPTLARRPVCTWIVHLLFLLTTLRC